MGHRELGDVVAGQLQGAFAPDAGLGILGKGGEAVDLLEDSQEEPGSVKGVEATEVLIVLVKTADNQFDGVVGARNDGTFDAIE